MLIRFLWLTVLPSVFFLQGCGGSSVSLTSGAEPIDMSASQDLSAYYAGTSDKSDEDLRVMLHDIIKGHRRLTYDQAWDILKESDEDPNNSGNVLLFYTGESVPKGGEEENNVWNREHVWAKSIGFPHASQLPYSDAHHLRPCDIKINSTRGNKFFAMVKGEPLDANGNKVAENYFEPSDSYKGDVARMILYMDVRYEGGSEEEPELVVSEDTTPDGTPNTARFGKLSDLLRWNELDPVDDLERKRNETVFGYQKNRNPFIDHPEFVKKIWGFK